MRVSTSLLVKSFLSKLHPPIPTTARESKQLLNILETSFRRHLDDVHPAPQSSRNGDQSGNGPPDPSHEPTNATNLYLEAVLRHPLLAERSTELESLRSLTGAAYSRFETALLEGSTTLTLVRECARQYHTGIKTGEKAEKGRNLGPRIAAWMSSESGTLKKTFLTDHRMVSDVLPVMYADGLEEVVWNWLRMLYERSWASGLLSTGELNFQTPYLLRAEDDFVSLMMRASIQRGSLNDAALQFVQACEYRAVSGRAAVEPTKVSDALQFQPLLHSWKRLSASVLYRRSRHGITASLFDEVLRYSIPVFKYPVISKAFLLPYHPEEPSAQALYQELQSPTFVEGFLTWQKSLSDTYHKAFLMSILDSAQLSLQQKSPSQAQFLLEFAEKHYPRYISTKKDANTADRLQHARQEVEPKLALNFQLAVA